MRKVTRDCPLPIPGEMDINTKEIRHPAVGLTDRSTEWSINARSLKHIMQHCKMKESGVRPNQCVKNIHFKNFQKRNKQLNVMCICNVIFKLYLTIFLRCSLPIL